MLDTMNTQGVASMGDDVYVTLPHQKMTPDEARMHAAWLVAVADVIDPEPEVDFANILEAVKNT